MKKGDRFKLTEDAIENYGEVYRDRVFVVTHAAFGQGLREGQHPGYDEGLRPQGLYDFKDAESGEISSFSVYDCEVKKEKFYDRVSIKADNHDS